MVNFKKKLYYNLKYSLKCWLFIPITFTRRVIFSKNELERRFFWEKWGFLPKGLFHLISQRETIWIIASSGGEVTQSISFSKKIKEKFPHYNLVLSTESYDTFKYAQTLSAIDFVFFHPWDLSVICRRVLKKIKPHTLIVIERCYYPVLFRKAKELKVKTLMCSGLINYLLLNDNFFMQRSFDLAFFKYLDRIAVKSRKDFDNLCDLGAEKERISVLGEMKFDLEHYLLGDEEKTKLRRELNLSNSDLVFIVGSIHKEEVVLVFDTFVNLRRNYPEFKLILAPRWSQDIPYIKDKIGKEFVFQMRSALNSGGYDILIVDTFGELPRLYGISNVAFIAGSILPFNARRQGHSIFEPLVHGIPIIFGPHLNFWRGFTEQLKEVWQGCEVKDTKSLTNSIITIVSNADLRERLKAVSKNMSRSYFGIVDKHVEFIERFIY